LPTVKEKKNKYFGKEIKTIDIIEVKKRIDCCLDRVLSDISIECITVNTTDQQRGEGGIASRCSGGKDDSPRPQHTSIKSIGSISLSANIRWVPPSSIRRDVQTLQTLQNSHSDEKQNVIFRRVRGYQSIYHFILY
jgi:hypothetical protein